MDKERMGLTNKNNVSPSSGVMITNGSSAPQISDDNSLSIVGNEFIQIMRSLIKEEIRRQAPKTYIGKIVQKVSDRHYDVMISGNNSSIIHNIYNNSWEDDFQYGEFVEIMDTENNINTAYILRSRGR